MTGTTEEKNEAEIWGKLHHTFCNAIMASRHHQGRPMDVYKLCDVEQLKHELEIVAEKITSLTEERDKLKSKIDSNEYYCTKCSDCNWEGSSKFLRVSQFDECDISCPCCNSNNLVDSNKALNDDQSISNLRDYIDMQAFRLSKAEEENKELKKLIKFSEKKSIKARYFYTTPSIGGEYGHLSNLIEACENIDIIQAFPAMITGYSPRWYVRGDANYTPYYTEIEAKNALSSLNKSKGEEE